jgi:3-hydroxyisobutyrate dehydrogenase-like beta-hydroxyacid dehydrogenase
MEIGFIGLGQMGAAIAYNLLQAGHQLIAYNRTREKTAQLAALGAQVAERPAEACNADIVVTMLADDRAVEAIVFGQDGLLEAMPSGATHVSMSTISVALSERLTTAHRAAVQRYVAAPVFGRPDAAAARKLFIIAAGQADTLARCQPLFDAIGQRTLVAGGDPSAANLLKLTGNMLIASVIESLGEAIALARKGGIAPERYMDIMSQTLFTIAMHANYGALIADERLEPGFKARLGLKDIRLVLQAADALEVPMPTASLLHDQFIALCAQGDGELDWTALALLAARNAGLTDGLA